MRDSFILQIWQKFTSTFRVADVGSFFPSSSCKSSRLYFRVLYITRQFLPSIFASSSGAPSRMGFCMSSRGSIFGSSTCPYRATYAVHRTMVNADGVENVTHRGLLMIFESVLEETIADLKAQGREDEFVGAKVRFPFIPTGSNWMVQCRSSTAPFVSSNQTSWIGILKIVSRSRKSSRT